MSDLKRADSLSRVFPVNISGRPRPFRPIPHSLFGQERKKEEFDMFRIVTFAACAFSFAMIASTALAG